MPDDHWLIVGLGNPGPEYSANRHNVGVMVTEVLAARIGVNFKRHRARADVAEGRLAGLRATVAKPRAFMNLSGGPVAALRDFYKISPDRIAVVHDELDIPFGTLRVRLDRKSTRLNSSHEWSSYAVFCLKKKKYINRILSINIIKRCDQCQSGGETLLRVFCNTPHDNCRQSWSFVWMKQ